jgi:lipopolysaccharide export system permease protein
MGICLLHRTIFYELFRVFFLCWVALTSLILLGGIVAEASQQGLGPAQILQLIPFLVPTTMPYTLPATCLFATCVVYGRLSHDNEILAVKAAGINLIQVTWPAIFLGATASLGTLFLYFETIPVTQWEMRTRFVKNIEEMLYNMLRKDGCIRHPQIPYTVYAKRVEGRRLIDAQFMHRDAKTGEIDFVARAREAELSVDLEKAILNVTMWNGSVRRANGDNSVFEEQPWPIELADQILHPDKSRPSHMSWSELGEFNETWHHEIETSRMEIVKYEAAVKLGAAPPEQADHVRNHRNLIRMYEASLQSLYAEYQVRPALSLGCLCFVLVGCPVGIWFSRSDYLSSFITCFLPIITIYYPLMLCGINLSKSGKVPVALAVWPANALMALAALILMRRLLRN